MCTVCVPNVRQCSLNERITEEHCHIVFEVTGVSHRTGSLYCFFRVMEVVAVLTETSMASMLALGTNV